MKASDRTKHIHLKSMRSNETEERERKREREREREQRLEGATQLLNHFPPSTIRNEIPFPTHLGARCGVVTQLGELCVLKLEHCFRVAVVGVGGKRVN